MTSTDEQQQKEIKEALEAIATLKATMTENKRGLRALYYNREMRCLLKTGAILSSLLLILLVANNFFGFFTKDVSVYITITTLTLLFIGEQVAKNIFQNKIVQKTTGLKNISALYKQKGLIRAGTNLSLLFLAIVVVGCGICIQLNNWWYIIAFVMVASAATNLYADSAFFIRECRIMGFVQFFLAAVFVFFAKSHYEFWVLGSICAIYVSSLILIKWDD